MSFTYLWAFEACQAPVKKLGIRVAMEMLGGRGYINFKGEFADHDILTLDRATEILSSRLESDPIAFEAGLALGAYCLINNMKLPPDLKEHLVGFALGNRRPPKSKGALPSRRSWRDELIYDLVEGVAAKTALKHTSSNEEDGESACHVVARALQLIRFQPDSYSSVKRIWLQHRRQGTLQESEGATDDAWFKTVSQT